MEARGTRTILLRGELCQAAGWVCLVLRLRLRIGRRSRAVLTSVSFSALAVASRATLVPPALTHQLMELLTLLRGIASRMVKR